MHLCFITHEYPKAGFPHGGIGSFVKTIATALVQNKIQVSVVGINYIAKDEIESIDGVTILDYMDLYKKYSFTKRDLLYVI